MGLAVGGRAGARLAGRLAMPASRTTLIRILRTVPDPSVVTPTVLGVDDFAIRRGHRYATILIDMHTHQPVDVLPDRTADTLADWLAAHPGVRMICRDRGGSYAEGANRADPGIQQVADRWHLLHNLSGHVQNAVARHRRCLRSPPPDPPPPPSATPAPPGQREANTTSRWQQIHQLKATGAGTYRIARELRLDPKTVRRYAAADSPDDLLGPARTGRRSLLDPHKPYLQARIDEGVISTTQLLQEIVARGYRGGERTLRRWLIDARTHRERPPAPPPPPSARTITSWIMRPADKLSEDDTAALKDARARCPDIAAITDLAHGFTDLVRQRHGDQLDGWITHRGRQRLPGDPRLRHRPAQGPRRGHRRTDPALELRRRRRPGQPHQDDQTSDVRPRQIRPTPHPHPRPHLTSTIIDHRKCARASFHCPLARATPDLADADATTAR